MRVIEKLNLVILFSISIFQAHLLADMTVNEWASVFSEKKMQERKLYAKKLYFSGIESPQIFDSVESDLKKHFQLYPQNILWGDYLCWLTNALSSSGSEKYLSTLKRVKTQSISSRLQQCTGESIQRLTQFKTWNKVLSKPLRKPFEHKRYNQLYNMLLSNDPDLIEVATLEMRNYGISNSRLMDVLTDVISQHDKVDSTDQKKNNALYSMIQTLGANAPNTEKRLRVLENLIKHSKLRKIRNAAEDALALLKGE